jgi:hypothetical protein
MLRVNASDCNGMRIAKSGIVDVEISAPRRTRTLHPLASISHEC